MCGITIKQAGLPPLVISYQGGKVTGLRWSTGSPKMQVQALPKRLYSDLEAYFAGKPIIFDWPLDWSKGTAFQLKVWKALQKVPYGETRSYQWLAKQIGKPAAVRAVGNANGANPFPLVIPCHRIIRKDGSLGGYSSGLAIKRHLLSLEQMR